METKIITDRIELIFLDKKVMKQGDPLSPLFFNFTLEIIFKKVNWNNKGITINGVKINNLRFADDISLIVSRSQKELELMIIELNEARRKAGFEINPDKTKIMSSGHQFQILINKQPNKKVKETIYLGQIISLENNRTKEVDKGIALECKKFLISERHFQGTFYTQTEK